MTKPEELLALGDEQARSFAAPHPSPAALKQCPFCGSEAHVRMAYASVGHRWPEVKCDNPDCEATSPNCDDTEAGAIAAWNTRADGWRPMETAPKDGTQFLMLGDPDRYGRPIWIDRWWGANYAGEEVVTPCWEQAGHHNPPASLIGWMPLPAVSHQNPGAMRSEAQPNEPPQRTK